MTAPNQSNPDGALNVGEFADFQAMTEEDAKASMTNGAKVSIGNAETTHKTEVRDRITTVEGSADIAVTTAQAAANTAATAESTAASASERASYWEAEFVVASAAVVLGVNELLIGLVQNVPGGLTRTITDMHVALLTQPNGMEFELKKWDATGTTATVLDTYTLAANVTRANWADLNFAMASRERVFVNVTSVTGSTAPIVLQVLLFGVME
ncbi:hypothetical protein [Nocardia otitidiscaviarum]|uniref:hypothetical protein n=1 Tax=Nocardia otitidiscaviarum TaxID=1823 RepID=UPI002456F58C|nr:hypothetical protein [Nocardia otitidiscaviarum]